MTTAEIFEAGYAIPLYDISTCTQTWRYNEEDIVLPFGEVWPHVELPGVNFRVAPIESIRSAAHKKTKR